MNNSRQQLVSQAMKLHRCFLSLTCFVFVASELVSAQDFLGQASLAGVLPESTQLVVTSQNVSASYSMLEKSDIGKQFGGPIWANVIAKQKAANIGSILNPRSWLSLDWKDAGTIDQAGAVAAFLDSNGETAIVFFAKLGPNAEKHPFVQQWMTNQGGASRFQSVALNATTKFYSLPPSAGKSELASCIAIGPQWICISSSAKAVQTWLSSPKTKNMQASVKGPSQQVFADGNWAVGETRFWASPWAILSGYAKRDPKLFKSVKLFGLEGLAALSGSLLPPSATESVWRLSYTQQLAAPLTKGLAMFSFKSGPLVEPPKIFNESMDQVSISYLDMKPWFQGVTHAADQMIDEDTPGNFGDVVDSLLTDPEGPKVDVRKELIYPSGPLMFQFGVTGPGKKNANLLQHKQVWACVLQDAKKATTLVNKLFENDKDIKTEQIGAYRVWSTVNDDSLFVAVSKGETQAVSIAAIDSNFIYLSTDTAWLKGLLAGTDKSAPKPGQPSLWKDYLQKSKRSPFAFQQGMNLGTWMERSWTRLPEPAHKEFSSVDLPSFCLTKVLVPGIVTSDIPKWSQVQSAFGVLTHVAVQNEQGIQGTVELVAKP